MGACSLEVEFNKFREALPNYAVRNWRRNMPGYSMLARCDGEIGGLSGGEAMHTGF
jgi:hypothetical protein